MIAITFTPLHSSTLHTLSIGGGSDSPTFVDGLRDVFTTAMEDDTSVFLPVRTTSGTVRFYNRGNAWDSLAIPSEQTHIPVVLSGNGDVWKGYVNTGNIGSRRLYGFDEECDLNVQCPLMELDTQDYDPLYGSIDPRTSAAMVSLTSVINEILNNPFGDDMVKGASLASDADANLALSMYVSQLAFYEVSTDDEGNQVYKPKYTKKAALEAVLRQACCTACWTGTNVKIVAFRPDTSGATVLNPEPIDTESIETAVMPFKKIKVSAEANGEDTPVELPSSAIQEWVEANTTEESIKYLPFGLLAYTVSLVNGTQEKDFNDTEYSYKYLNNGVESGATVIGYCETQPFGARVRLSPSICLHDYPFDALDSDYYRFNSDEVVTHTLVIRRTAPFFIYDAYLDISLELNFNLSPSDSKNYWDRNGTIEMYVIIGDKMYNPEGDTWETKSPREVFNWFGVEFNDGKIVKKNYSDWHYEEPSGYAIPVIGETLSGIVEVGIRTREEGGTKQHSDKIVTIEHFKAKTLRLIRSLNERNTFTASGDGRGIDDVQLDFCSERRADNGVNALFWGSQITGKYAIVKNMIDDKRPEQWVAERRAAMTVGKPRSLVILRQEGDIADGKYTFNGKTYQTLLTKHEWAENITEKQLIEL